MQFLIFSLWKTITLTLSLWWRCLGLTFNGLTKDTAFDHLNILLIEKDSKTQNDRTWCFWEEGLSEWEELIHHRWDSASFKAPNYQRHFTLAPYHYKMIRGIDFYQTSIPTGKGT